MSDVFDIELYDDSTSDEIAHQLLRLRSNPLWTEVMSDPMHPEIKTARRAHLGLIRARDEARQAEAFRPAPLPADVTPGAAKAMHDRLMGDPEFRRAYRDPHDPRSEELGNVVGQLLHWAHPPEGAREAGRQTPPGAGIPGDRAGAPPRQSTGRGELETLRRQLVTGEVQPGSPEHARFQQLAGITPMPAEPHEAAALSPAASEGGQ